MQASFGGEAGLAKLLRENMFLRNVLQSTVLSFKEGEVDPLLVTAFGSMGDLINYLNYRELAALFRLDFLV